jgi:tripartite-type tricarboxylate transporter receptor subunit TctC
MQERLAGLGYDAVGTTPEEFAAQIEAETAKWAKVIQADNLKP